ARPGTDQSRRPLLQRSLPGHAAAGLHTIVRTHARASANQDVAQRGLSRGPRLGPTSRADLYWPDRRIFQLLLWKTSVPVSRVSVRNAPRDSASTGGRYQLPERVRVYSRYGIQAFDGAGALEVDTGLRVSTGGWGSLLSGSET